MSNATETSFYKKRDKLCSWSQPSSRRNPSLVPYDITTFIATAIERSVDFVPISFLPGLKPLGQGGTAQIQQSIINLEASFALKQINFPNAENPDEADIIRAAIVELIVLTHPGLSDHPNVLKLEGVCWDSSDLTRPFRPILITEKCSHGDLGAFMSKSGHKVTPGNRVEICADIINAVLSLHANGSAMTGVVHGDIKPENILVFQREDGEYYGKLCDFGFSSLFGNHQENLEIDLPVSHPWNAPELCHNRYGLSTVEVRRADIYSVGLVCLWLMFGRGVSLPLNDPWSGDYDFIFELKLSESINDFVRSNLNHLTDVDEDMKSNLCILFRTTTADKSEKRIPSLAKFVETPPTPMASPVDSSLPLFTVREAFGDLMQHDHLLRKQVVKCLQTQHAANIKAEVESICNRDTARETTYGNQLFHVLMDGGLALQSDKVLYEDHNIYHEIESGCSHELASLEKVLLPGDIVIPQLHKSIAKAIGAQGRYREAREILSNLLERMKTDSRYGLEHREMFYAATDIMDILRLEGKFEQALETGKNVASTAEENWGDDDLRTADVQKKMALILAEQGSYEVAERLLQHALNCERHILGAVHPIVGRTLNSLGMLLTTMNRNEDAANVWIEAIGSLKGTLKFEDPSTLSAVGNLATWLDNTGNYYGAEKLYRIQLTKFLLWVGPKHPTIAGILSNLSIVIKNQDRYGEAEEYARKAYQMNKDLQGPEDHYTLSYLNNLANILGRLERYSEAEAMLTTVVLKYTQSLGAHHPHTITTQLNLAQSLRDQNRLQDAKSLELQALATCQRFPSEDKSLIIHAKSELAHTLHHLAEYDAAITTYRAVLEAREKLLGMDHPHTLSTMTNLAAVLHGDGQPVSQYKEAENLHVKAIEKSEALFGERHTKTLASVFWLAVLRAQMGEVNSAEELFQRAYKGFVEALGEGSEWAGIVGRCLNHF
ncbi:MAG: hypothetical protein Q9218_005167 [Villophora microphyllina]